MSAKGNHREQQIAANGTRQSVAKVPVKWRDAPCRTLIEHDIEIEHFKLRVAQPIPKVAVNHDGDGGCRDGSEHADTKGGEEGEMAEGQVKKEGGKYVKAELGPEECTCNAKKDERTIRAIRGGWADTIGQGKIGQDESKCVREGAACVEKEVKLGEGDKGEERSREGGEAFGEGRANGEKRKQGERAECQSANVKEGDGRRAEDGFDEGGGKREEEGTNKGAWDHSGKLDVVEGRDRVPRSIQQVV